MSSRKCNKSSIKRRLLSLCNKAITGLMSSISAVFARSKLLTTAQEGEGCSTRTVPPVPCEFIELFRFMRCCITAGIDEISDTADGDAAEVNFKGFSNFSFTSSWLLFDDVLTVSLICSLASLIDVVDNVCADDVSTDAGVSTALSLSLALSTAEISCTCCGLSCSSSDTTELAMFCDITPTGTASSLFSSIFEGAVVCVATASKTLSSASVDLMTLLAMVVNCCGTGSTLIGAVVGAVCVVASGGCTSILVTSIGFSCSFDDSLTSVSMSLMVSSFILPEFLAHCVLHLAAILAQVVCNEMPHCLQELNGSDFNNSSSFHNLLQLFSHNVFMEFMMRTNCLTNTLYTGPLLLRAYFGNCIQNPLLPNF
uniref:Uncharacterized protein n=1 Tax=Glossina austeni TaxID=7395 RepID=A0A1A9V6I6_GLOAU